MGVDTLITIASIGFTSLILSKILDAAGQAQYSQYVAIAGIGISAITIITIIAKVFSALGNI